jgi:NAD(P)-dependent dehydrogenase (short-subunit alcohol dehydrogenase family)
MPRANSLFVRNFDMNSLCRFLIAAVFVVAVSAGALAQTPATASTPSEAVVLITGSNRGIGLALASAYAKSGWRVIATCRDPARAAELVALAKAHPNLTVEALDVTSPGSIDALVARHRGQPIDVLLNNAGTSGDYKGQLPESFDEAAFQDIMRVNAFAPLRLSTALLDNVSASRQKKIIAISSGRGSVGKPFTDQRAYFYDMSKAALNLGMRKLQARVADKGVLVGVFAPGVVDTDLNENLRNKAPPQRKLITTEESAAGVMTLIANLTAANQDAFMNYNGERFSW